MPPICVPSKDRTFSQVRRFAGWCGTWRFIGATGIKKEDGDRATLEDFVDLIHVHPTMAGAPQKIAAIARTKNPAKFSCCAE